MKRARLICLGLLFCVIPAIAQPPPDLRPPRGEIPPSLWEAHPRLIIAAAIITLLVVIALVVLLTRPRRIVNEPPEIVARRRLTALLNRPENGALLAEVSRVFRRYVIFAFRLPPDEMTTTELDRLLHALPNAETTLVADVGDFLRQCDEEKFAPQSRPPRVNAAGRALALLEKIEARRRQQLVKEPAV